MFPGIGTVINVATIVTGAGIGVLVGSRMPTRTRELLTDVLGLTTIWGPLALYLVCGPRGM